MTHFWRWIIRRPDLKGRRCRIIARGKLNSCLVQFADGEKVLTSRYAVRKIRPDNLSTMTAKPVSRQSGAKRMTERQIVAAVDRTWRKQLALSSSSR